MADQVWNLEPEYPVTRRYIRRAVQSPPSAGFVQRRRITDRELPTYVLRWSHARNQVIRAIDHMREVTKRGVLPILYTPPGETQRRVRIVGPGGYRLVNAHGGVIEVLLEAIR